MRSLQRSAAQPVLSDSTSGSKRRTSSSHPAPAPPTGVSAAFLIGFLAQNGTSPEAPVEQRTTRSVAAALKRRRKEAGDAGPYADSLAGEEHFITGGALASRSAAVHVAHAWDASFADLITCLATQAEGELDQTYALDVFTSDLQAEPEDPVAEVQRSVAAANRVLLVLDAEAKALSRVWVLFEALLAVAAGKLHVCCSAPGGFGSSEVELTAWEGRIDAADWVLAQTSRRSDERRLRGFAERSWEVSGKGVEQRLAQLKRFLRREVYGQLLIGAVEKGDVRAVEAALDHGASPEQQDSLGNTVEELASFHGYNDIEELIFVRRMRGLPHRRLSAFFDPQELLVASEKVDPDVLAPFLTEPVDSDMGESEEAESSDGYLERLRV